jgi:hypothetical protein
VLVMEIEQAGAGLQVGVIKLGWSSWDVQVGVFKLWCSSRGVQVSVVNSLFPSFDGVSLPRTSR